MAAIANVRVSSETLKPLSITLRLGAFEYFQSINCASTLARLLRGHIGMVTLLLSGTFSAGKSKLDASVRSFAWASFGLGSLGHLHNPVLHMKLQELAGFQQRTFLGMLNSEICPVTHVAVSLFSWNLLNLFRPLKLF
jgi:hypothetical protein